mmetsp:Transcript_32076/g.72286  ORF Transcript_32076/g.72286 Transcript_32076/m.72286 type:complete len:213 (-) Transcript_32076:376-1014(-)
MQWSTMHPYFSKNKLKGLAISNSGPIRESHNSFARAEPFVMEESKVASDKDDVFHFIAYVPHNGRVYELDGLKKGPIRLGEVAGADSGGDWLTVARPAIQARIERYATSEIRFNLMGLVKNKKDTLLAEQASLEQQKAALAGDAAAAAELEARLQACRRGIEVEDEKLGNWKLENMRRKHNYVPFVVNLLRILAERNQLKPMLEKAQQPRPS